MTKVEQGGELYHHHFGKQIYWKERFGSSTSVFEWYHPYKHLKDVITQYTPNDKKQAKVTYLGCGTSKLPEEMYNDGFRNIISIDSDEIAINAMRERYNENMPKTFLFLKMDAMKMDFGNGIFTHAIDKGLFDSILSGYNSTKNAKKYLSEVFRILDDKGTFFCMSYRGLEDRARVLESQPWRIVVHKVYRPKFHQEQEYIRKEFVSKKVLADIERQMDVEVNINEPPFSNNPDTEDIRMLENITEEDKENKKLRIEAQNSIRPRDVESYYLYVCCKADEEIKSVTEEENPLLMMGEEEEFGQDDYGKDNEEQDQQAHLDVQGGEEFEPGDSRFEEVSEDQ
jgi:EEF1A lysine methyltransferase 4